MGIGGEGEGGTGLGGAIELGEGVVGVGVVARFGARCPRVIERLPARNPQVSASCWQHPRTVHAPDGVEERHEVVLNSISPEAQLL